MNYKYFMLQCAIILAAGRGKRLMPLTEHLPKCLVKIGNKPILFYQLRALEKFGVTDIVIITGYQAGLINKYVTENFPQLIISYVHNSDYLTTDDIYSLYLAKEFLNRDFMLLDCDVLFHPDILRVLSAESVKSSVTGIKMGPCGEEEMKVCINSENMIERISKNLPPHQTAGEFLSISIFTKDFAVLLPDMMDRVMSARGKNIYSIEAVEKIISEKKNRMRCVDITSYPAVEIDFVDDLKIAENDILPKIISEF